MNSKKANKKRLHYFSYWVHFLKSKHNTSTIFAQILPKFVRKVQKTWPPKKQQNSLHFDFRCHFHNVKAHTAILRTFSQILPKFPTILISKNEIKIVDFHWIKSFGSAVAHPAPPPPAPMYLSGILQVFTGQLVRDPFQKSRAFRHSIQGMAKPALCVSRTS